jgi:hypothetical protein
MGDSRGHVESPRRMHHLGIGTIHALRRVVAIADNTTVTVTVIALDTAEILSTHLIEPTKTCRRNQQGSPGPMARAPLVDVTHVATHHNGGG